MRYDGDCAIDYETSYKRERQRSESLDNENKELKSRIEILEEQIDDFGSIIIGLLLDRYVGD